ncbi:MAG: PqiC family protein [Kordiimonadaceae bacterium]|nr:PqiC family protein [Kordiimonadaceae bacterium]
MIKAVTVQTLRVCVRISAVFLALAVAGCGPIISFGGDDPAGEVYALRYSSDYASYDVNAPIIYLSNPQMLDGLDGTSIAVMLPDGQRTLLAGASWSAHISDLIREYVSHSLGAQTGANIISEGGLDIKAGCRLGLKVWSFELATGETAATDAVNIALQFSLVRMKDSVLLSHPTFSQSVGVSGAGIGAVVDGFKAAMAGAAGDYGPWLRDHMAQCSG